MIIDQFFLNSNDCVDFKRKNNNNNCNCNDCLKIKNYLSEYDTEEKKQRVRENLGIQNINNYITSEILQEYVRHDEVYNIDWNTPISDDIQENSEFPTGESNTISQEILDMILNNSNSIKKINQNIKGFIDKNYLQKYYYNKDYIDEQFRALYNIFVLKSEVTYPEQGSNNSQEIQEETELDIPTTSGIGSCNVVNYITLGSQDPVTGNAIYNALSKKADKEELRNYYKKSDFKLSDYYSKNDFDINDYYKRSDFDINDYYTIEQVESLVKDNVKWKDVYPSEEEQLSDSIQEPTEFDLDNDNIIKIDIFLNGDSNNAVANSTLTRELNKKADKSILNCYVKKSEIQDYYTKNDISSNYLSKDEFNSFINYSKEYFASKEYVDNKITTLSPETLELLEQLKTLLDEDDNFNEIVRLLELKANKEDVYTKSQIDNKHFLTEHQSLSEYLTESQINDRFATKNDLINLDISSKLSEYAKISYIEQNYQLKGNYQPVGDYLTQSDKNEILNLIEQNNQNINLDDYVKQSLLYSTFYTKSDSENIFIKRSELDQLDLQDEINNLADILARIEAKMADMTNYARLSDLDNYVKWSQVFTPGQGQNSSGQIQEDSELDTGQGESNIFVDDFLSLLSTNPVQNKVIKEELDRIISILDTKVNSSELSNYVHVNNQYIVDNEVKNTTHLVQNQAVKSYIDNIKNSLQESINTSKLIPGNGIDITNGIISVTIDNEPFVIVDELPEIGLSNKIYLLKNDGVFKQYIYNNGWIEGEDLNVNINLDAYLKSSEAEELYQPKDNYTLQKDFDDYAEDAELLFLPKLLVYGEDVWNSNISAAIQDFEDDGQEETTNIYDFITEELNKYQKKLTAGENITISLNNVISANLTPYLKTSEAQSTYATISDLQTLRGKIQTLEGKITTVSQEDLDKLLELEELLSNDSNLSDIYEVLNSKANSDSVYTKDESDNKYITSEVLKDYLTPDKLTPYLFSKSYNDLTDKPELFNGDYNSLTNKPNIPSDVSDLTDNSNLLKTISLDEYSKTTEFAEVAFSGDYNDLTNTPTKISVFTNDVGYITSHQDLSGYALKEELFSGSYNDLDDKPILFSGNYNDLYNKPNIPTIPTKLSQFENDLGYINEHQSLSDYATKDYVNEELEKLVEINPQDILDLKAAVEALEQDGSINSILEALSSKANSDDVFTKGEIENNYQTKQSTLDQIAELKQFVIDTYLPKDDVYSPTQNDNPSGEINNPNEDPENVPVNPVSSDGIKHIILSQEAYDKLTVYEDNTLYFVYEEENKDNIGIFPITLGGNTNNIGVFPIILH